MGDSTTLVDASLDCDDKGTQPPCLNITGPPVLGKPLHEYQGSPFYIFTMHIYHISCLNITGPPILKQGTSPQYHEWYLDLVIWYYLSAHSTIFNGDKGGRYIFHGSLILPPPSYFDAFGRDISLLDGSLWCVRIFEHVLVQNMTLPDYVCYMYPEFLKCSEKTRFLFRGNFGQFWTFKKIWKITNFKEEGK